MEEVKRLEKEIAELRENLKEKEAKDKLEKEKAVLRAAIRQKENRKMDRAMSMFGSAAVTLSRGLVGIMKGLMKGATAVGEVVREEEAALRESRQASSNPGKSSSTSSADKFGIDDIDIID
jgi:hypothetical protein